MVYSSMIDTCVAAELAFLLLAVMFAFMFHVYQVDVCFYLFKVCLVGCSVMCAAWAVAIVLAAMSSTYFQ